MYRILKVHKQRHDSSGVSRVSGVPGVCAHTTSETDISNVDVDNEPQRRLYYESEARLNSVRITREIQGEIQGEIMM